MSFYRHFVQTLVSEIPLVLYRKCHFYTYPLVFHLKLGDVPLVDEQCSAVSQVPALISRVVIFRGH